VCHFPPFCPLFSVKFELHCYCFHATVNYCDSCDSCDFLKVDCFREKWHTALWSAAATYNSSKSQMSPFMCAICPPWVWKLLYSCSRGPFLGNCSRTTSTMYKMSLKIKGDINCTDQQVVVFPGLICWPCCKLCAIEWTPNFVVRSKKKAFSFWGLEKVAKEPISWPLPYFMGTGVS
jgi:hypothetical protein